MRNYNNKITYITKYIIINIYFLETLNNNVNKILIKISIEIYLTDNLKINILIGIDILISY